ncbi:50S ribosomal protein L14 [Candidatus Gottesmanbacteria bacterium]|nr:50S ribosomal protein L14 [Candidatus Gottesmanbacteria bacterium]
MVQLRSLLNIADNTGAHKLSVIQVAGRGNRKIAYLGDIVNCVVKTADPEGMVKQHEKVKAVIVRTKKKWRRKDGSYIGFGENAAVIIDNEKDKNPRGTRIFGPVTRELKDLGFGKIVSMAAEVY